MQQANMLNEFKLIIGGQRCSGEQGELEILNPATGLTAARCAKASVAQVNQAVSAAKQASKAWQQISHDERKSILNKIADGIEKHAEMLAELVVLEQGKPLALAQMEVQGAIGWTRYAASMDLPVEVIEDSETKRIERHRQPLGVVASITPWNWPLMIAVWHIMPALRAGNVVISKPSEYTPLSTLRLCEIIQQEVPAGVISIVVGAGEIGEALSSHPDVQKVVFTGSTRTGQHIMAGAAQQLKHLTLELGGNDAGIVLPDTNIDEIAAKIFNMAFLNAGQTCAALKRLYVHESQYEALSSTTFGPVQNQMQYNKVKALIAEAIEQGAKALSGQQQLPEQGYFIAPTILTEVSDSCRVVQEEQFGPVLPVLKYTDINDAIARANDSEFGLGGSIWSSDLKAAQTYATQLQCGTVWINTHAEVLPHAPFGGWKMSGLGAEFGLEGLLENTIGQTVHISKV
jgi:acyl-CoA reductase-like NAD-dependent aldehyde dehydrogenase